MEGKFGYVIKVDGKEVWEGGNPKEIDGNGKGVERSLWWCKEVNYDF